MREEENLRGGLPRLVELAHVTPSHLTVTSRRYFQKTPTGLLADLRLRHAAVLLSRTSESIGAIALGAASVDFPISARRFVAGAS